MCCLFGLIDYAGWFSPKHKNKVLSILAAACEVRGTDATGIAYLRNRHLTVCKRPCAAHLMQFHVPPTSRIIMGHTRMTTQGSEKKNYNNHPFLGKLPCGQFALAHNGVLYNDRTLRREMKLPKTKIETDSYIAVQLLEKNKSLDLTSLGKMAEQVEGSFTFTVMDDAEQLYIVKGSNPMCLYHFKEVGFYFYASTQEILDTALKATGLVRLPHEKVAISDGEILKIGRGGVIDRATFQMKTSYYGWYSWCDWPIRHAPVRRNTSYHELLLSFGAQSGIPEEELNALSDIGLSDYDLELAIFDDAYRQAFLTESLWSEQQEATSCTY